MCQVYNLAKHRGSTNYWGDRKSNQHKCWFLVSRGENWSTLGKTSRSRVENQQTQPTYDVQSGNRTWATLVEGQCSHHCVTKLLPPHINVGPSLRRKKTKLLIFIPWNSFYSRCSTCLTTSNPVNSKHYICIYFFSFRMFKRSACYFYWKAHKIIV